MPFKIIFLLTAFISSNVYSQIDYKGFPQWSKHQQGSTEYFLYTPSKMKAGSKYPIALFMHGCCGTDYHASLRNTVDPPVRMWHNFGANTQVVPTYIISPATSRGWQQHFKNLKAVIDDLIANHNGDPQRVYVCGFSMGGDGTVKILQQYPGFFAAAIPMGMSFSGDSTLLKDVPIWTAQGETDWWSRNLRKNVADIRHLNGYADTGSTWITGVNPRYSNFKGVGHGVQWDAASTLPLLTWAYSKVNDGNKYPQVYFASPAYRQQAKEQQAVPVDIRATDEDGSIARVQVFLNNKLLKTFTAPPYTISIQPVSGDNTIDAVVYDNKGKKAVATTVVKVDSKPEFPMVKMLPPKAGEYFVYPMHAGGNGNTVYHLEGNLPEGLRFFEDGFIRGVPLKAETYNFSLIAVDEDNDSAVKKFRLAINNKDPKKLLITNAANKKGIPYEIAIMKNGETPNFDSKSARRTTYLEEINFSNIGRYAGLPFIKTDINDTAATAADFLSFDIDSEAIVYVAYEKFDKELQSSIPGWLKEWKKENGEIVAQYRYFNIYSKHFPKGKISLPGADAPRNGVVCNYFVMVKKQQ